MNNNQTIAIVVGAVVVLVIAVVAWRLWRKAGSDATSETLPPVTETKTTTLGTGKPVSSLDETFGRRVSPERPSAGKKDGNRFPDERKYRSDDDEILLSPWPYPGGIMPVDDDPDTSQWDDNGGAQPVDEPDHSIGRDVSDAPHSPDPVPTPDPTPAYEAPSAPSVYDTPSAPSAPSSSDWGSSSSSSDSGGYSSSSSDSGSSSGGD